MQISSPLCEILFTECGFCQPEYGNSTGHSSSPLQASIRHDIQTTSLGGMDINALQGIFYIPKIINIDGLNVV